MPTSAAIAAAARRLSPVIITTSSPSSRRRRIAAAELGLTVSATAITAAGRPSTATPMRVLPAASSASTSAASGRSTRRAAADDDLAPLDDGADAVPGEGLEARRRPATSRPRSAAAASDRVGERVLGAALGRAPAQLAAASSSPAPPRAAEQHDVGHARLALGDRPGLVEHDGVELVRGLERGAVADQDAVLGALAGADHDRRRRRQAERARAGDDQHGDEVEQGVGERGLRSEGQPDDERERGDADDRRDEVATRSRRPAARSAASSPAPARPGGRSARAPCRCRPAWRGR